ncbi:TetR family transcriptional regulator [Micromonospora sp. C28SCA-DRY-2]|uniref:TetR family transcriptional regulator n=1 Tax=Micromonospora sp. C28SCA-DRY-2 TaxID=3059522 RepID=UPI002675B93C|nr:TetR family transcriptional regulator [Micromonospora sp. C28SCA-DRY-2]MDO3702844.1 TetR family transcriptional regulator [Micromonospora sp. C28SCA-DRY-2]
MTAEPADDTRTRILRAALDLFAEHGYQRTALRQIADRLRLTKAAILYHFPAKEHLLAALIEPLVADLERLLDSAEELPTDQARWAVLEGWVDTMLTHRRPLGMLFHDIALITRGDTYNRLMRIAMRANDRIAGPDAGRRERVRAVQAVAMCSDPVVFFTDVSDEVLRADMLDGVRRLLAAPGADAPRAAEPGPVTGRRRPGRPRALGREQVEAARRMHAAGTHSVDDIAAALGVSRATVYRHLEQTAAK